MSSVAAVVGLQKCHFSNRKTYIRKIDPKNFHPCAGKTIGAESALIVVVGLAYTACIIFSTHFIEHHDFSPNASKHIISENQAPSSEQDANPKIARGV